MEKTKLKIKQSTQTSGVKKEKLAKKPDDRHNEVGKAKKLNSESKIEVFSSFIHAQKQLSDIVFANLIVFSAIFLSVFLPFVNLALPVLLFLYLEIGLMGFIYNIEREQNTHFETLFVHIKKSIKIFCVAVIKLFTILFWTCFLIVPGVVCLLNYSFSSLIVFENGEIDARGVLLLSKELVKGHRGKIALSMLLAAASVCASVSIMFALILFIDVFCVVPKIYYAIFLTIAGVLDLVLMALPLAEISIVDSYILAKQQNIARKCD